MCGNEIQIATLPIHVKFRCMYTLSHVNSQCFVDDTRTVRGGYVLIFRFVKGDGVRRDWDDIVSLHER